MLLEEGISGCCTPRTSMAARGICAPAATSLEEVWRTRGPEARAGAQRLLDSVAAVRTITQLAWPSGLHAVLGLAEV
jgi:hypothetical protein